MFYALLFVAILAFPVWAAAWRGRRAETCLPYGMILATLIAFCFGLADALPAGAVAAGLFLIACWAAALWRTARRRAWRDFASNLCTPGMLLFAALFVFVVWVQKNRTVWVQDDFNYWFRAWRAMWVDQKLPLYADSSFLFHQSYPPGMPAMEYLASMLRGAFVQGDAFCVYGVFCISMLMPLCAGMTWRRAWLLPAAAFAALVVPIAFNAFSDAYYYAYETLAADDALGMTFGLALFVACVEAPGPGRLARLSLLCAMMTLTKPSGVSVALIALAAAGAVDCIRPACDKPRRPWTQIRRGLTRFILTACLPLALFALWRWKLAAQSIDVLYGVRLDARILMDLLLKRDTSYRAKELSAFLRFPWQRLAVNNPEGVFFARALSHCALAALLALPALGMAFCAGDRSARRRRAAAIAGGVAGYGVYALGLLAVYLFAVPRLGGAGALPSFERYMSTYYQAVLICMLGWMMRMAVTPRENVPEGPSNKRERIAARAAIAYLLALVVATVPLQQVYGRVVARRQYATATLNPYCQRAAYLAERIPPDAVVGLYYLQYGHFAKNLQAVAYPVRTVPRSALPPVGPPGELLGDEGWREVRGFDYVYITEADESFAQTYGFLFEGGFDAKGAAEGGRLYRVRLDGDAGLTFVPVET